MYRLSVIIVAIVVVKIAAQPPAHPPVDPPPAPTAKSLDKTLLRFVEDDAPVRGEDENREESMAYEYVVKFAKDVPSHSFRSTARSDITFAQMLGPDAANYRGEVVHIEGRLKRIRDLGPTKALEADGIKHLYEAWIFSEIYRDYSYCVLFTELPADLPVAEQLDRRVTFDGYFFKNYRFAAGDGPRRAPLLIGRTINVVPTPTRTSLFDEMTRSMPIVLIVLTIGIGLVGGLIIWLRVTDRWAKQRIDQARNRSLNSSAPGVLHEPHPFDHTPSLN